MFENEKSLLAPSKPQDFICKASPEWDHEIIPQNSSFCKRLKMKNHCLPQASRKILFARPPPNGIMK
jgi:hypothetical protein